MWESTLFTEAQVHVVLAETHGHMNECMSERGPETHGHMNECMSERGPGMHD